MTQTQPAQPESLAARPLSGRIEIMRQRLVAIAERMGETLARTAVSPNIKERRDHSCAIFDAQGRLLAQAAHIPVHLGSMSVSVQAVRAAAESAAAAGACPFRHGDVYMLNDPFAGGTHLPDLTVVAPVFAGEQIVGFVANRAHHADIGGASPGSMGIAESIHAEGLRIPPVRWFEAGVENTALRALLLANVRAPRDRVGDLQAQLAAIEVGRRGLMELVARCTGDAFEHAVCALLNYAERRARRAIHDMADGVYQAVDLLEGDGIVSTPLVIAVTVTVRGEHAAFDFVGTSAAARGCVNCPMAVTRAAVNYVISCLGGRDMPHNAGIERAIEVSAPDGCLVNAAYPSAVAAGNVETSQRIVDVLLSALATALPDRIPAASAGTMMSLSLGGVDRRNHRAFTYYETIGGGAGASSAGDGASGIHTHMTNTRNTPVEVLEAALPVRVRRYALARGSGGAGLHTGGCGIIREIEALGPMTGALLADRFSTPPPGRAGGRTGSRGSASIRHADGTITPLAAKCAFRLEIGDVISLTTPGGGGWGG